MGGTVRFVPDVLLPEPEVAVHDISPTARALLALELVQDIPGITADRLADKLGVSERAARRYVGILREAGIPIESVRGPYGGYRVGRGHRPPPLVFNATEALGLVMAVLDGHHDAGDPTDPVGSALGKLMRVLPAQVAAQAEAVRRTAAPAPDRGAARPDTGTTTALVQACSQHRLARLEYRSAAGSQWVVEVEPWAVVVRHGRWYLLCRVPAKDAVRAYRVDRVLGVETLEGTFVAPVGLDPVAMLEEHLAVGWEFTTEILVDAPLEVVARCVSRSLGRLEPVDDATSRLTGTTSNPYWYAEQLAVIPAPFQVLGGVELLHTTRALGERLVNACART
jgi:predicted DNA-binding transcriptional regulator YafY